MFKANSKLMVIVVIGCIIVLVLLCCLLIFCVLVGKRKKKYDLDGDVVVIRSSPKKERIASQVSADLDLINTNLDLNGKSTDAIEIEMAMPSKHMGNGENGYVNGNGSSQYVTKGAPNEMNAHIHATSEVYQTDMLKKISYYIDKNHSMNSKSKSLSKNRNKKDSLLAKDSLINSEYNSMISQNEGGTKKGEGKDENNNNNDNDIDSVKQMHLTLGYEYNQNMIKKLENIHDDNDNIDDDNDVVKDILTPGINNNNSDSDEVVIRDMITPQNNIDSESIPPPPKPPTSNNYNNINLNFDSMHL